MCVIQKLLGDHDIVGKMAPKWIHDHETSMCMKCGMTFTFFVRRHHCRGCGVVSIYHVVRDIYCVTGLKGMLCVETF